MIIEILDRAMRECGIVAYKRDGKRFVPITGETKPKKPKRDEGAKIKSQMKFDWTGDQDD